MSASRHETLLKCLQTDMSSLLCQLDIHVSCMCCCQNCLNYHEISKYTMFINMCINSSKGPQKCIVKQEISQN